MVDEIRTSSGRAFRIGAGEMLVAGKGCCIIYDDYPSGRENERSMNAARIVACVNALAGIPNPAAVKGAVDALREIAEYTGEGGPGTPWREIVRAILATARRALAALDAEGSGE